MLTILVKPLRYGHLPQPGSWFTLFYADVAEIVGCGLCILRYIKLYHNVSIGVCSVSILCARRLTEV